jgi:hypothetical protein
MRISVESCVNVQCSAIYRGKRGGIRVFGYEDTGIPRFVPEADVDAIPERLAR